MSEEQTPQRWWQTVPVILTATTGIITAVTGLVVALYQAGFFEIGNNIVSPVQNNVVTQIPQVAGMWKINQTGGSHDYTGTLSLSQNETKLSGNLIWNSLAPATVISGDVSEHKLKFVVRYDGGVEGTYEGEFNASFDLVKGDAIGQGQHVTWTASR